MSGSHEVRGRVDGGKAEEAGDEHTDEQQEIESPGAEAKELNQDEEVEVDLKVSERPLWSNSKVNRVEAVRALEEEVQPTAWGAASCIQACCRTAGLKERQRQAKRASAVVARSVRRYMVRRRLRMQLSEVEQEALQICRDHMLECEKVLRIDRFFHQSPNAAVEKWRLARSMLAYKNVVRALYVHYSSQGLTDPTHAFKVSKLQWLSLCTEARLCQNLDNRISLFKHVFEQSVKGTDLYIPLDVPSEPSHMILCDFVQGLLEIAVIAYPSNRGWVSDSWHEIITSALQPAMVKGQLAANTSTPGVAFDVTTGENFRVQWAGWNAVPSRLREDMETIFGHFAMMQQYDMEGDSMNISEFMDMFLALGLIDGSLRLQTCISIFVRCNQFEMAHFLGPAISGYKLEERLQMSWPEFVDAMLECGMIKYGGEAGSPFQALMKFVTAVSSGWHRFKALRVLRQLQSRDVKKYTNTMCLHGADSVQPLEPGKRRITLPESALPSVH
eukprot:TRINITY_DN18473_c0_g2_i2.p1 TRINITY_DN18473_c0_g2~~TRINITY_DN18473_c0_g2_i2.p1  ORF type:complete len:501 (-),score=116.19 TRINITY_DN18473_c0_g2_i2:137-1639(-)